MLFIELVPAMKFFMDVAQAAICDMGINLCRCYVFVAQEFLNRSQINTL